MENFVQLYGDAGGRTGLQNLYRIAKMVEGKKVSKDVPLVTNKRALPELYGQDLAGKVLVFPRGKGGIIANIPTLDNLDKNPCEVIKTGNWVKVNAQEGIIEVTKQEA